MTIEEWVQARGDALLRFAYLMTGDRQLAEDVVQDVLVIAVRKWPHISRAENVDAYLRRAVVNRRNSWLRRRHHRDVAITGPPEGPAFETTSLDDALAVRGACAALPPRSRAAIVLRYYEDLTYEQIGDVLDCTAATARSLVHRARTQLKSHLQPTTGQEHR